MQIEDSIFCTVNHDVISKYFIWHNVCCAKTDSFGQYANANTVTNACGILLLKIGNSLLGATGICRVICPLICVCAENGWYIFLFCVLTRYEQLIRFDYATQTRIWYVRMVEYAFVIRMLLITRMGITHWDYTKQNKIQ